MSIQIREGTKAEVANVLRLADQQNDPFALTAVLDVDRLAACDVFFVAVDGSQIVGFCGLLVENSSRPEIVVLYVLPCHTKQGVGTCLLGRGVDHITESSKHKVYCEATTPAMKRLVERLGAERRGHVVMTYTGEYEEIEELRKAAPCANRVGTELPPSDGW